MSNRTATWQGIRQSLRGVLVAGKTYTCSGWVKVKNAPTGSVTIVIAKIDDSNEGKPSFYILAEADAVASRWTQLRGSFTLEVTGTLRELAFYFQGPPAWVDLLVDDASVEANWGWRSQCLAVGAGITLIVAALGFALFSKRPEWGSRRILLCGAGSVAVVAIVATIKLVTVRNLLQNPSFEMGTNGWHHSGGGLLATTANYIHSGSFAALMSDRAREWSGVAQPVKKSLLQPGKIYRCSAWVRVQNGDKEPVMMTIRQRDGQGTRYHHTLAGVTASPSKWTHLSGRFTHNATDLLSEVTFCLEGPGPGVDLLVDDAFVGRDRLALLVWPAICIVAILEAGLVFGLATKRSPWVVRCGAGGLTMVLVMALSSWLAARPPPFKALPPDPSKEFKLLGFENVVSGKTLEIKEDIHEPTIYQASGVRIYGTCTTNLAIVARIAQIYGRVLGKVYFRGEKLVIMHNAEVVGGIDSKGQVVQYGKVGGETLGRFQRPSTPTQPQQPGTNGIFLLRAIESKITGQAARYEQQNDCIGFWMVMQDYVTWNCTVSRTGHYGVAVTYACAPGIEGSQFTVGVDAGSKVDGKVKSTGSWTTFITENLGEIELPAGEQTIAVRALTVHSAVMNLRQVKLTPN